MALKTDILELSKERLSEYLDSIKEPKFRAKQLFSWLHQKRVKSFDEMSNLSKNLREKLDDNFFIGKLSVAARQQSKDGTVKYLFSLADGNSIETVAMFYEHGLSVCVSSQVGCKMGCVFCASTLGGLQRNLTAAEILEQVYAVGDDLDERVDSVVLMGIGEPLDNFCNVILFYDMITDEAGYNLSNRSVSLSTCGLCDKIDDLAKMEKQLTLSVSLHAAEDATRSRMMPVNSEYPIARLMESCKNYRKRTGRRVSFEYTIVDGVNNRTKDADNLARLLYGMDAHVNLIPVNAARGGFFASREDAVKFCGLLKSKGINATVRRTLGTDIAAACGQLRQKDTQTRNGEG